MKIWQMCTDLPKAKQGAALFLTLSGKPKDIDVDSLTSDDGIKIVIEKLNPLYLKDKVQNAYIWYETFEPYKRPKELNMKDYINEFERLHSKIKEYDMALPDSVLAYKLLKQAELSETHKQSIRATIIDLSYENMKLRLKKTSIDICIPASQTDSIKVEPVMHLSYFKNTKDTMFHIVMQIGDLTIFVGVKELLQGICQAEIFAVKI